MNKRLKTHHPNGNSHTPQKQNAYIWFGGVVAVVAAIVGVVLFARNDGASDGFVPEVTGAPRVTVAQDVFDYGDVKLGTTVETVFMVQNVGDQNLSIMENPQVEVVEGC